MNLIGHLLIYAVVSVVPGFFVLVFASSAYRSLKQLHQRLLQAELAVKQATPREAPAVLVERQAARAAYNQRRRSAWGILFGAICRLPPAVDKAATQE